MDDAAVELSDLAVLFWIRRDGLEPIGIDKVAGAARKPPLPLALPPVGSVVERKSFSSRIDRAFPEPIGFCDLEVPTCNDSADGVGRLEFGH